MPRAADHVDLEIIGHEVVHHLEHGPIEALADGHALVPPSGQVTEHLAVGLELRHGHACEGGGHGPAVVHLQALGGLAGEDHVLDLPGGLPLKIAGLVDVIRVLGHPIEEEAVVEVDRVRLAEQRAIEIEHRDPILRRDIPHALGGDHVHIGRQGVLSQGPLGPQGQGRGGFRRRRRRRGGRRGDLHRDGLLHDLLHGGPVHHVHHGRAGDESDGQGHDGYDLPVVFRFRCFVHFSNAPWCLSLLSYWPTFVKGTQKIWP